MSRVALFGGSFDPIHVGHVFIASCAKDHCRLDQVIFIPCWQSPHKPGVRMAAAADRLQMTTLATQDLTWAHVSPWELERPGPSYSWQTAEHFRKTLPDCETLYWIIGMDQWAAIDRWDRIDHLASLVEFIVFPRGGEIPEPKQGIQAVLLTDAMQISGTNIRTQGAQGVSITDSVAPAVAAFIAEKGLYRD